MSFWLAALALTVVAIAAVLAPLALRSANSVNDRIRQNRNVQSEQLLEWRSAVEDGSLDQTQFDALEAELLANVELENNPSELAASTSAKSALVIVALLVPVLAVGMYWVSGFTREKALFDELQLAAAIDEPEEARNAFLLLLPELERVSDHRQDQPSWRYLLAQLQSQLQRYPDAAASYRRILDTEEGDAELWAMYAQASYLANQRMMNPLIEEALQRSLALNPQQRTALGLMGMHAFEQEEWQIAADSWGQLLVGLQPGSSQHNLISTARGRALEKLGQSSPANDELSGQGVPATDKGTARGTGSETQGTSITVMVTASPELSVSAGDTLFVYAKAASGPPMPLAIVRRDATSLPLQVSLDDSMAMMPQMTLSRFDQIEILARISPSGQATVQPGDWQGTSGPLERKSINAPIEIVINTRL